MKFKIGFKEPGTLFTLSYDIYTITFHMDHLFDSTFVNWSTIYLIMFKFSNLYHNVLALSFFYMHVKFNSNINGALFIVVNFLLGMYTCGYLLKMLL